ncbi:MAG: hypothetical protein JST42_11740, partial [Bacteroidetes bacterium]|nr:hypothetical protein [Bacteroidota bacterium]
MSTMPAIAQKPLFLQIRVKNKPSVVLVSPFDPKMTPRHELEGTIKSLVEKAERQLLAAHSSEEALPVVNILRQLVRKLDYSTHRRAIALFASRETGEIAYMDMEVQQRLVIDEPFRIRDLADYKRNEKEYLVMVLGGDQSRTYLGRDNQLRLIKNNTRQSVSSHGFVYQMDNGLGSVLKVYPLPVFIVGPAAVIGDFRKITRHPEHVAGYLQKDNIDWTECRLQEWLKPELAAWDTLRQRMVRQQMEKAEKAGKLITGLDNVARAATSRNSQLLLIPKDSSTGSRSFCKDGVI